LKLSKLICLRVFLNEKNQNLFSKKIKGRFVARKVRNKTTITPRVPPQATLRHGGSSVLDFSQAIDFDFS